MERGHGRTERRTCTIMGGVPCANGIRDKLDLDRRCAALRVVAEQTVHGRTAWSVRYYITNLLVKTGAACAR